MSAAAAAAAAVAANNNSVLPIVQVHRHSEPLRIVVRCYTSCEHTISLGGDLFSCLSVGIFLTGYGLNRDWKMQTMHFRILEL